MCVSASTPSTNFDMNVCKVQYLERQWVKFHDQGVIVDLEARHCPHPILVGGKVDVGERLLWSVQPVRK